MRKRGQVTFRCEPELQAAFVAACQANDTPASQVLRAAMREYLEKHAQKSLPLKPERKK